VWISLRVATDVLPLLVNACSEDTSRTGEVRWSSSPRRHDLGIGALEV
jgi:hypothetical protein